MSRDRPKKTEAKPPPVTFIMPPLAPDDPNAPTGALVPLRDTNSDDAIMAEVASGDTKRFAELVNRHDDSLIRWLSSRCLPGIEPEDVAQETWMKVLQSASSYQPRPGSNFRTWLFTVAGNNRLDEVRRLVRANTNLAKFAHLSGNTAIVVPEGETDPDPLAALAQCFGKLPERTRKIVARRNEDVKNQVVANELTPPLSPERCSQLYHQALDQLAECIRGKLS